jgi:hypothetical protein
MLRRRLSRLALQFGPVAEPAQAVTEEALEGRMAELRERLAELVRAAPDETPMLTDIERAQRLQAVREAIRARARGDA